MSDDDKVEMYEVIDNDTKSVYARYTSFRRANIMAGRLNWEKGKEQYSVSLFPVEVNKVQE